jgi:hypothetical protein
MPWRDAAPGETSNAPCDCSVPIGATFGSNVVIDLVL